MHICKLPLNKCQTRTQTGQAGSQIGQAGSQNRSDRFHQNQSNQFPRPVRPILYSRPHPQKPKMQKKCTSSPLTLGICSRDAMQVFSNFLFPLVANAWMKAQFWKKCNLELLKYTKFITRCYTCPNEQVRYSTAS
jgi:hypothetical protein